MKGHQLKPLPTEVQTIISALVVELNAQLAIPRKVARIDLGYVMAGGLLRAIYWQKTIEGTWTPMIKIGSSAKSATTHNALELATENKILLLKILLNYEPHETY